MSIHDRGCPHCDAVTTLQPHGPERDGHRWYICSCCSRSSLVRLSDGEIVREIKKAG